jgi:hypothetical protein
MKKLMLACAATLVASAPAAAEIWDSPWSGPFDTQGGCESMLAGVITFAVKNSGLPGKVAQQRIRAYARCGERDGLWYILINE